MVITGRVPVLLLIGLAPVIAIGVFGLPQAIAAVVAWIVLVLLLVAVDVALAASPRLVRVERALPSAVRLGEPAASRLLVTNAGARRLRGVLRDAWQPSAGARPTRWPLDLPAGERRAVTATLTPTRRGERRTERVVIRAIGPLRVAGR